MLRCSSDPAPWSEGAKALQGNSLLGAIRALVSLLDGERGLDEIAGEMVVRGFNLDDAFAALNWLELRGFLREGTDPQANALSAEEHRLYAAQMAEFAHWTEAEAARNDPPGLATQLALKHAVVALAGSASAGASFVRAMAATGLGTVVISDDAPRGIEPSSVAQQRKAIEDDAARVNPFTRIRWAAELDELLSPFDDAPPNLLVYCSDRFDPSVCAQINRMCVDRAIPWIPYRRHLHEVDIGPLVVPRETACFACYETRMQAAQSAYDADDVEDRTSPRLNLSLGIDLLALEVLKFLTGAVEPITYGRMWRLDIFSGLLEVHPVLKLPRCAACGTHRLRPARKLWEEAGEP